MLPLSLLTACSTVGKNEVGIQNFDEVSPGLYRGAQPSDKGFQTLAKHHIKTVINLCESDEWNPREETLAKAAGMTYVSLPQDASKATVKDAEDFLKVLATVPAPVFVHCHAGRDRTGLAVAAYRMQEESWTAKAALRDLYTHGHQWLLFPKVRAVVSALAKIPPAELRAVAAVKPLTRDALATEKKDLLPAQQ